MNITNQVSSNNKAFLIAALLCLLLTTFPFAQGWISHGDFIPRALFLALVVVINPKLFVSKDVLWLGLFFAYMFIVGGVSSLIEVSAIIMEFLMAIAISNYIITCKNKEHLRVIAWYGIITTIIIMVSTSIVDAIRPGIVREMVKFGYSGENDIAHMYTRMGVCRYSFAMIIMCMSPVFLHISKVSKHKAFYLICFALVCYFVYIAGITTCLIILLFMVLVYIMNRKRTSNRSLFFSILIIGVVLYLAGFLIVELLMPFFEGTTFYSHFAGLLEFYGKSTMETDIYDVGDRVDLYKDSLATFLGNPLFGSVTGKTGGHNYFLDRLAHFGIIGTAPLFVFLHSRFRALLRFVPSTSRLVFEICIIGFYMLGFLKNVSGVEYWIFLFVYIPCILRIMEELNSKPQNNN